MYVHESLLITSGANGSDMVRDVHDVHDVRSVHSVHSVHGAWCMVLQCEWQCLNISCFEQ